MAVAALEPGPSSQSNDSRAIVKRCGKGGIGMKEWFEARQGKRVVIDTMIPGEKGGSYSGTVAWVGEDAVVLQLANLSRLIAFHAIESAMDAQEF